MMKCGVFAIEEKGKIHLAKIHYNSSPEKAVKTFYPDASDFSIFPSMGQAVKTLRERRGENYDSVNHSL